MGRIVPAPIIGQSAASGAQVIDGSLKFDSASKNHLERDFLSDGNRKTWTWSSWVKKSDDEGFSEDGVLFEARIDSPGSTDANIFGIRWRSNGRIGVYDTGNFYISGTREFRDTSAFYHLVLSVDTTQASNNISLYVNGDLYSQGSYTQNSDTRVNSSAATHRIGARTTVGSQDGLFLSSQLSQTYFIDGQALGPENFGFTDPLTNTWRPKKYTGSFTTTSSLDGTVWTSKHSGTVYGGSVANVFDNDLTNRAEINSSDSNNNHFTISSISLSSASSVGVYVSNSGSDVEVSVNDTVVGTIASGSITSSSQLFSFSFTETTVTSIKVRRVGSTSGWYLYGILVNGTQLIDGVNVITGVNSFYLPMDGNSPIGQDKSGIVTPNNGSIWSNSLTSSSGFRSSEPKINAFDGNTSSICSAVGSGTITFTSPVTFASNSTIRVFLHGGDHTVTVNGGSNQTISAGSFQTVTYSNSGNPTFVMTFHRGGGADTGVRAIEIDGVILTDGQIGNDWTPVNFGGSVSLDKATGALPILNTTQGGTQATVGYFGSRENKNITVTVAGKTGGGNAYFFDGVERDSLALLRGTTITFDTRDSSNNSHPFKLSSTNADSSGGTEYTDGVAYFINGGQKNGSDYVSQYANNGGGTGFRGIRWTVPHNVSTTYYYCTAHNGMGEGGRLTSTTDASKADPFAWKCVLALPLVGTTIDMSSQINLGTSGKSITNTGTSASSASSNFYNGSFYWNGGTSNRLSVANDNDIKFGTGDFCVEFWVNLSTSSGNQYFFDFDSNGGVLQYNGNVLSYSDGYVAGSGPLYSTGVTLPIGEWVHLAVTREGSTGRIFVDGAIRATGTTTYNYNQTSVLDIGNGYNNSGYEITGYMQDFRMYKGVAKYTSDFIPAKTSPDVLPDTPSGVSGGSKLTKIIDGAVTFGGTAKSKLRVNDSTDFTFGTNDFCIEFYYYNNSLDGTYDIIFDCMGSNRSGIQLAFETDGDYRIEVGDGSNNWIWQSTGIDAKENKWTHFALTREGSTFRVFEDGVLLGTQTSSTAVGDPRSPAIGGYASDDSTNYGFYGFISNFRIVNGSAVYTSKFTPPAAPLTNVTNTKLLCCQSNESSSIAAASPNISGGINNGKAWSSLVSGPTRHQDRVSNAFDGTTSGPGAIPAYPGTLTFAPGLSSISSVKIYGYYAGSGVTLHVNGSQQSPSSGAFTLTISTSTLDSVVWTAKDGFNYMRIDAIEIDSTVLIDPVVAPDDSNADATNFNPFNTDINTVRGQESGYATFNPLDSSNTAGSTTFSDGNLKAAFPSDSGTGQATASIYVSSGKWYCEFYLESTNDLTSCQYGLVSPGSKRAAYIGHSGTSDQYGWEPEIDRAYNNGTNTTPTGKTFTSQWRVAAMALDLDNGTWEMFIDGIPTGTIYSGISGTYTFAIGDSMSSGYHTHTANFGQKPFKFPPPDGFQPLNAANVRPETVIARPDKYVGVTIGNFDQQKTHDIGFQPDLIWHKARNQSQSHFLTDSVRGKNSYLISNNTNSAGTFPQGGQYGITSFNYNGWTQGSYGPMSEGSMVAWTWKAGGNKNTFNVDDVGYANASDVNMSLDSLNSATYNKTQNWSAGGGSGLYSGSTWGPVFDGTPASDGHNIAHSAYVTNNGSSTLTFSTAISGVLTVKACQGSDSTSSGTSRPYVELSNGQTIRVDGGTSNPTIHSFGEVSNITSLTIRGTSAQGMNLIFVKLDGKLLVDTSVTPPNAPSIAPSGCSVGTKQGFSIIKYDGGGTAGDTIPHGLLQTPEFVVVKDMEDSDNWQIYHAGAQTSGAKLLKFTADGATSNNGPWNNTAPTSTLITLGGGGTNDSGNTHICYAWHSVPGLQKFGKYSGNQNANGPFIELGFRPAMVWIKGIGSGSTSWRIFDKERSPTNTTTTLYLRPNVNNGDLDDTRPIDIVSNGFKIRVTGGGDINLSSGAYDYIYCAWAEVPAFNLYGGQSNAR